MACGDAELDGGGEGHAGDEWVCPPHIAKSQRTDSSSVHFAPWYRNQMRLELSDEIKPVVEKQTALEVPCDWVSEQEAATKYLNRGFGNSYDFNQVP